MPNVNSEMSKLLEITRRVQSIIEGYLGEKWKNWYAKVVDWREKVVILNCTKQKEQWKVVKASRALKIE